MRSSGAVAAASLHTDNTGQNVNHILSGNGHVPNMLCQVNQVVFQFAFYLGPGINTKRQKFSTKYVFTLDAIFAVMRGIAIIQGHFL